MFQMDFDIATDTLNGSVDPNKLDGEIRALSFTTAVFEGIVVDGTDLHVDFDVAPEAGEQTTVTSTVAAHDGVPDEVVIPQEALLMVSRVTAITESSESEAAEIAGFLLRPQRFVGVLSDLKLQIAGRVRSNDGPTRIRVYEDGVAISDQENHADTSGAWDEFQFRTNVDMTNGRHLYTVRAWMGGTTTSADLQYCVAEFIEVK